MNILMLPEPRRHDIRRDTVKMGHLLSIADQIQAFGFARKTGEIFITNAPPPARINLVLGEIVDAQFGSKSGLEAAIEIINLIDPESEFVVDEKPHRKTISMPFTQILCEAAKAKDEMSQGAVRTDLFKRTEPLRQIANMPTLRVTLGTEIKTYPIRPGIAYIGRSSVNDIMINDSTISQKHAKIEFSSEGVKLTDLNSTNGTFVAGEAITERLLGLQDSLQFGGVHCLFINKGDKK